MHCVCLLIFIGCDWFGLLLVEDASFCSLLLHLNTFALIFFEFHCFWFILVDWFWLIVWLLLIDLIAYDSGKTNQKQFRNLTNIYSSRWTSIAFDWFWACMILMISIEFDYFWLISTAFGCLWSISIDFKWLCLIFIDFDRFALRLLDVDYFCVVGIAFYLLWLILIDFGWWW